MPLPPLGRHTNEKDSSSWPSPHANCHTGTGEHGEGGINIQTAVKQWPTPTIPNGGRSPKGGMNMTGVTPDGKKRQVDLQFAVRNWPTPAARDGTSGATGFKNQPCLPNAVHHWPTPAAQDAKNSTLPPSQKNRDKVPGAVIRQGHAGSLNADFVELLMGYGIGWTDIDCDEPQPWPGWPAGQGEYQHDYEPSRVIQGQKNRAKRLRCLGNSVVPQQAYPIFKAIMELEEVQDGTD